MNIKNILIKVLLLTATLNIFADPGHDVKTPPSPKTDVYTATAPFYTHITIPAASSNLISVTVTVDIQIDQQIVTIADPLNTSTQRFFSVFHCHPLITTPTALFRFDHDLTNNIVLNPGETNVVLYSFTDTYTYTTTNATDLAVWLLPNGITSNYGSTIDMGGGNCSGSAARLPSSGVTVTVTYTYDCGCSDPDDDGDCEEIEHQKKPRKDKKPRKHKK